MKRVAFIGVIVVAFGISAVYYLWRESTVEQVIAPSSEVQVVLTEDGFLPQSVTLKRGGVVTFSAATGRAHWPASNLHPQHTIYPDFDPGRPLSPEESWEFTFDRAGTWAYHDHLRSYYVGTITVVE